VDAWGQSKHGRSTTIRQLGLTLQDNILHQISLSHDNKTFNTSAANGAFVITTATSVVSTDGWQQTFKPT
jgi:hypothetical protein